MKKGLWRIVTGEETAPTGSEAERTKFAGRRIVLWPQLFCQLAYRCYAQLVILRIQLSYGTNWQTNLRKRWGNKAGFVPQTTLVEIEGQRLGSGVMTELLDALSVAGENVSEEDQLVYLLARLPESYSVLVTALEANEDVPKLDVVTEHILHQERKLKYRSGASLTTESTMTSCKIFRQKSVSVTIVEN